MRNCARPTPQMERILERILERIRSRQGAQIKAGAARRGGSGSGSAPTEAVRPGA